MSKLAVAGVAALTVAGVGIAAISQIDFHNVLGENPADKDARLKKEAFRTWLLLSGLATAGALIAVKSSHPDLGKGILLGSGAILAMGALSSATTVTKKA